MDKKETHVVVMRNTPAALGYDDDHENDGEPLSRPFLPSFFSFLPSILPFFGKLTGGRGGGKKKTK